VWLTYDVSQKSMKHLVVVFALALGLSVSVASETKTIDPKTLSFSLATINDTLPTIEPEAASGARDHVIQEDDWRQFEAISRAFDDEMQEELSDVRRIFEEKSKTSGGHRVFSEIHIRKRIARPLSTPLIWSELLAAIGTQPSSVVGVRLQRQGMVKDGFSVRVGQFTLFGIRHDDSVDVLCFDFTRTPGLSEAEAESLASFFEKSQLIVVHWPSAAVLKDKRALFNYLRQTREKKG